MINKSQLAITLSKLKQIPKPNIKLEQYTTDSETAAEIVWFAFMNNDIKNKVIADLGCGNGILGIAALLLGARQVYFVDIDPQSLVTAKQNINSLKLRNAVLLKQEVQEFSKKVDTVLQNPPFGVQTPYADRPFLEKSFQIANSIYSLHKIESEQFIRQIIPASFALKHIMKFRLPIKKTQEFHKQPIHRIQTACFVIKKI